MKSMVLTGIRQMQMIEVPEPQIERDNEVVLRLEAVGVCGSDVHYYETGRIGSQVVQYPFRVGHECAAVVESVGSAVSNLRPGDRVAVDPAMSCWQCDQCRSGRPHTCRKLRFLGCPGQSEGCLAEKIVMPEESCFPLDSNMTFEQGALSEPLAIGYYAVKQSISMNGARIGILGAGPIGLSVLLCAREKGAAAVYMTEKIPERVEMAKRAGATWAGNPDQVHLVEEIQNRNPCYWMRFSNVPDNRKRWINLLKSSSPGKVDVDRYPSRRRLSFSIDLGGARKFASRT
jgi:L-iditol 2-dehydrogenase